MHQSTAHAACQLSRLAQRRQLPRPTSLLISGVLLTVGADPARLSGPTPGKTPWSGRTDQTPRSSRTSRIGGPPDSGFEGMALVATGFACLSEWCPGGSADRGLLWTTWKDTYFVSTGSNVGIRIFGDCHATSQQLYGMPVGCSLFPVIFTPSPDTSHSIQYFYFFFCLPLSGGQTSTLKETKQKRIHQVPHDTNQPCDADKFPEILSRSTHSELDSMQH